MIIKMNNNNSLTFLKYDANTTYFINDLTVLVPKESFSFQEISQIKVVFEEVANDGVSAPAVPQKGIFNLLVRNQPANPELKNYYECLLYSSDTLYLTNAEYKVTINDTYKNQDTQVIKLATYYSAKPEHKILEVNKYDVFYTDNEDNHFTIIDLYFNRYFDNKDLSSGQIFVKMITPTGYKHLQYIYGYTLLSNDMLKVSWRFDEIADAEEELLFAVCFLTPENNVILQTDIKSYQDGEILDADTTTSFYKEFKRWMESNAYYLLEGRYELRDAENVIEIIDKQIDMSTNRNVILKRDHKSNLITFTTKRYQDAIDLSKKRLYIKFVNAKKEPFRSPVVNMVVDNETIMFSWLITLNVTKEAGDVEFMVEALGTPDDEGKDWYLWQTFPTVLHIYDTLVFDEDIAMDDDHVLDMPEWYLSLLDRVDDSGVYWEPHEGEGVEAIWQ